jgi:hypothetical protein
MKVGDSIHAKDLKYPGGVEPVLHRNENPVVATLIVPALVTEEEATVAAEAVPAASEVPTTEQAVPAEKAEEAAIDKGAAKGGEKTEKKEKK